VPSPLAAPVLPSAGPQQPRMPGNAATPNGQPRLAVPDEQENLPLPRPLSPILPPKVKQ
jgi:hypothetical protein